MKIQTYLDEQKLIMDGAFGTYYMNLYGEDEELPELANINAPERVIGIHKDYINAGARIIRTNTFAVNRAALETDIKSVKENIKAAVAHARTAIKEAGMLDATMEIEEKEKSADLENKLVFIAGDIGPILFDNDVANADRIREYITIADSFLNEGIEVILFETFADMEIIAPVIKHIKESSDAFVMVHFCVNQFAYSNSGLSAKSLLNQAIADKNIDSVGFNCGVGPSHMEDIISKLDIDKTRYMAVLPNAGYPKMVQNRLTFNDNTASFVEKLSEMAAYGVDIIGGCCGTNPDYIKALSEKVSLVHNDKRVLSVSEAKDGKAFPKINFLNIREKEKNHKLIAVELAPPLNDKDEKILDAAHILKQQGVDIVTFPDSPSGRTRADSILMAEKIRKETGLRVMPHICCRDKNAIAIRASVLGAQLNDITEFLVITGDPIPMNFRQTTKSVFNFDSIGMMKVLEGMNEDIFSEKKLTFGGAINQNRVNLDIELERIIKKKEAGAEFFMTQPVFSKDQADILRDMKEKTGATILVGIMPFISRKNAEFMKNEMAGVEVPDEIIDRYEEGMSREEGEATGVNIAREVIKYTEDFADGYYFSFPFNRVHMLKKIQI